MGLKYELAHADITAVFGGSGSGKTHAIKHMIAGDHRLMVWDFKREYQGEVIASIPQLIEAVKRPRFRLAFRPAVDGDTMAEQFDVFCRVAYSAKNLRLVIDELSRVTSASWAPKGWSLCTCLGRGHGLRIIGASQRPAHIDKDMIENASRMLAGRLITKRAWQSLEEVLGEHAARLPKLPDRHFLYWKSSEPSNVTLLRP